MSYKPTEVEIERRHRINLCLAAYAYEFCDTIIMSDAAFDKAARAIKPNVSTGHESMDKFFIEEFRPHTGAWIHKHPELDKLSSLYSWTSHLYKGGTK